MSTTEVDTDAIDRFQSSFHADLPFLSRSHHQIWYIFLVIAILALTFIVSSAVVVRGIVSFVRRKKLRDCAASRHHIAAEKGRDLEAGHPPPMQGREHGASKASRAELLSFAPSPLDNERLSRRKLDQAEEAAMLTERARRLAQHTRPDQTLHMLRRLNSL